MPFTASDAAFVGTLLSHLILGVYITVFGLYVRLHWEKRTPLVAVDYGVILVFVLSVITIGMDAAQQFFTLMRGGEAPWIAQVNATTTSLIGIIDFFAQLILIYRCWQVWNRVIWVAVVPGLLALTALVLGMCATIDMASAAHTPAMAPKSWWAGMIGAAMGISLAVNAVVSALMIARIWFVYQETKSVGGTSESPLPLIVSVLLESAIILFLAQLVYLVLFEVRYQLGNPGFVLVAAPIPLLYGLSCTAVMVRVRMNKSYETRVTTMQSKIRFGDHGVDDSLPCVETGGPLRAHKHLSTETSELTIAPRVRVT